MGVPDVLIQSWIISLEKLVFFKIKPYLSFVDMSIYDN